MRRGTPQGGTLSPLLFSFILDKILANLPESNIYSIHVYADDIVILSHDINILTSTGRHITNLLTDHGFKVNQSKFQLISTIDNSPITLENEILIQSQATLKYLGIFIKCSGIDYSTDIKNKVTKAKFAISTIKWTKNLIQIRNSYNKFYIGVIIPLMCYGIENYLLDGLNQLELHRTKIIRKLHSNKFRYYQMHYNYLSIHNNYRIKRS
eukprot:NODE_348_length_8996_cov_0.416433.p4 type:complete len:210 gc:universal NODE_348_length_8996_cov_0.416433:5371-6000(+)